jgi:hypothetical protein
VISFDSGGYVARTYLDESPLVQGLGIGALVTSLDQYAGLPALTASHLFVYQNLSVAQIVEFGMALTKGELDRQRFATWRTAYRALHAHVSRTQSTGIPSVPTLSIRDLADGLALYHAIRSGNPDFEPRDLEAALGLQGERLWRAYRCADHWLGDDEARATFALAGAFALSCERPIAAFLEAIQQIGKNNGRFLADLSREEGEHYLALWTGYEPTAVEDTIKQMPANPFLERRLDRLKALREQNAEELQQLGGMLFRGRTTRFAEELGLQFSKRPGGKVAVIKHDQDSLAAYSSLEVARSLAEGLAGLTTTMLCPLAECPFHRFQVCGRVSTIPDDYRQCGFKKNLESEFSVHPETLEELRAD